MKTIILAAGYATRLYPLTEHKPKALLDIKGRPLLDYILEKVEDLYRNCPEARSGKANEIQEILLISNHRFITQFEKYASEINKKFPLLNLRCIDDGSDSPQNRLGALRDLALAWKMIEDDEDCLILASDNYFDFSLVDAFKMYKQKNAPLLLTSNHPLWTEDVLSGFALIQTDENGSIKRIEEKPREIFSTRVAYATYFYPASCKAYLDKMLKEDLPSDSPGQFPVYLHQKGVDLYAYDFVGLCLDIGTKEVYRKIKKGILSSVE